MGRTRNRSLYASIASACVAAPSEAISRHLHLTAIPDCSVLLGTTGHLGTVTKTAPPLLEEQAKISLQESGTSENTHYLIP